MAKYINSIPFNGNVQVLIQSIANYMASEGFGTINYKGQTIWKKGFGVLQAPQYVAVYFEQNAIRVEAFIKFALFPGVYIGEMGTTGFFGFVPKSILAQRITAVENYIKSISESPNMQDINF